MSYSAATFYIDFEGGSDTARADLVPTAYANNGSGAVRVTCNSTAAYSTGAVFDIAGTTSSVYNGAWKVTIIDGTHVDLIGSTFSVNPAAKGTMIPRGGSSKTDAWKTIATGATSTRHAAGDTMRMMASPDETSLGINATWTKDSKTVTLASALTLTIDDGEAAWTTSGGNVTVSADTILAKENTKSAKMFIAAAFTTGMAAYKATGTLDLSPYQQVSFWLYNSGAAISAGMLSLRLCSDVAGVTTVNTIAIPAVPSTSTWQAFTVDTGGALGASIASVALYVDIDVGASGMTVQLDNIIACKASSAADSLSLTSLIGKVWNLCWVASTTYATNDIRKPTQPNRNGFRYKVTAGGGGAAGGSEPTWPLEIGATVVDGALTWTCEGLEDTWFSPMSINGTTIKIDNVNSTHASQGRGYSGDTETVATYKRETIKMSMVTGPSTAINTMQRTGTVGTPITYSGGWDRTNMTTQNGETWFSGQNGYGYMFYTGFNDYINLSNLNAVRCGYGFAPGASTDYLDIITNCHFVHTTNGINMPYSSQLIGVHVAQSQIAGLTGAIAADSAPNCVYRRVSCNGNVGNSSSAYGFNIGPNSVVDVINAFNNYSCGLYAPRNERAYNRVYTRSNNSAIGCAGIIAKGGGRIRLRSSSALDTCPFYSDTGSLNGDIMSIASHDNGLVAGAHLITFIDQNYLSSTTMSTIEAATDQRHTASGVSWKFRPKNTNASIERLLNLSVAKVAVAASALVTLTIWVRRDNTNISGRMMVRGGQIAGVPVDASVSTAPSINTWTQYTLTFTPTEAGIVEVEFHAWDGVGTANALWIDDFEASQA